SSSAGGLDNGYRLIQMNKSADYHAQLDFFLLVKPGILAYLFNKRFFVIRHQGRNVKTSCPFKNAH
ncbi:TPA: hypothetical protein ACOEDK_000001, partial [Enterobacter kobei]